MSIRIPETNKFSIMELILSEMRSPRRLRIHELYKTHNIETSDDVSLISMKHVKTITALMMKERLRKTFRKQKEVE